jgi:hypothetical protein
MTTVILDPFELQTLDGLAHHLPLSMPLAMATSGPKKPNYPQFYVSRKATVSGCFVEHTAENNTDFTAPYSGAEGVVSWMLTRPDPGSYHTVSDAARVIRAGSYGWQMHHEGTGGNRHSIGLACAVKAGDWPRLIGSHKRLASLLIAKHALAAADAILWLRSTVGIDTPRRRITADEYHDRIPGFVGHGELDPGRRYDPGDGFPWAEYFEMINYLLEAPDMTIGTNISSWPGEAQMRADLFAMYESLLGPGDYSDSVASWMRDLINKKYGAPPEGAAADPWNSPGPTMDYIRWQLVIHAQKTGAA